MSDIQTTAAPDGWKPTGGAGTVPKLVVPTHIDGLSGEENALLRSLAGMANNLNQLTKLSHQTGFYRTRLLIEGLLGRLKRIMDDYRPKGG